MRVSNVFKNVEIVVVLDGDKLTSRRKQIVTPGEMETFVLKSEHVERVRQGSKLEVKLIVGGTE